eukprot:12504959-Alexandrium_andersonii.AAC.1
MACTTCFTDSVALATSLASSSSATFHPVFAEAKAVALRHFGPLGATSPSEGTGGCCAGDG